jgi:hypothetical protein
VGGVILWVSRKKPKSKSQTKVKNQIGNVKEIQYTHRGRCDDVCHFFGFWILVFWQLFGFWLFAVVCPLAFGTF